MDYCALSYDVIHIGLCIAPSEGVFQSHLKASEVITIP